MHCTQSQNILIKRCLQRINTIHSADIGWSSSSVFSSKVIFCPHRGLSLVPANEFRRWASHLMPPMLTYFAESRVHLRFSKVYPSASFVRTLFIHSLFSTSFFISLLVDLFLHLLYLSHSNIYLFISVFFSRINVPLLHELHTASMEAYLVTTDMNCGMMAKTRMKMCRFFGQCNSRFAFTVMLDYLSIFH